MADLALTSTRLAGSSGTGDVLVVGPSLGTSVDALWTATAERLADRFEVIGWDLPGHGRSAPTVTPFRVPELAAGVRELAAGIAGHRRVAYAGVSLSGAIALELGTAPGPFAHVACIAGAARFGEPEAWHERAALVRQAGTPVLVSAAAERWFAPGFLERDPATGHRLLMSLSDADDESYALACEAVAELDLSDRLSDIRIPVLMAPGELDPVVPPAMAAAIAESMPQATVDVLAACSHLPPAADPGQVAEVLKRAFASAPDRNGGRR
jgi:pimeloyl-ACP methyl ester carboxylesterase